MEMVIFDQVILMPTLSICGNWFLNLAPWSFCMDCKTISKWSFWCWPIMQKPFLMLIIKMPSGNLITEIRSHPYLNFSKLILLCKPRTQKGIKYYWHHTQNLFWQNSNQLFLRPLCRAPCGQNQTKFRIQCSIKFLASLCRKWWGRN